MPAGGPARVLVMVEQPLIVEVIKLTLNHGVYVTREAQDVAEATAALGEWQPAPGRHRHGHRRRPAVAAHGAQARAARRGPRSWP